MLVIRRKAGDSLLIAGNIEVAILEVSGGQVKVGIKAPREVLVMRKEVHMTRVQNQQASADIPLDEVSRIAAKLGLR